MAVWCARISTSGVRRLYGYIRTSHSAKRTTLGRPQLGIVTQLPVAPSGRHRATPRTRPMDYEHASAKYRIDDRRPCPARPPPPVGAPWTAGRRLLGHGRSDACASRSPPTPGHSPTPVAGTVTSLPEGARQRLRPHLLCSEAVAASAVVTSGRGRTRVGGDDLHADTRSVLQFESRHPKKLLLCSRRSAGIHRYIPSCSS